MKKIHYIMVLDVSPSMDPYINVTVQGVNQVLGALKNVSKDTDIPVSVGIVTFDSQARMLSGYNAVDIEDAKPLKDLSTNGGTAVYEGIGRSLEYICDNVKKNDRLVVNVFTDGQNNTWGKYTELQVATKVKQLVNDEHTFAFIAANQSARQVAGSLNISNAMDYAHNTSGYRSAFWQLSLAARKYVEAVAQDWKADLSENFFPAIDLSGTVMKANGIEVTMNTPESVREGEDIGDQLPPYAPVKAYMVDEYPACPTTWMNGSAKAGSYFVPVKEGHGMWLDFNKLHENDHDVAVVISVQGINPITGQKTSALRLEKYENKCPVHDKEFNQDRFCKDCGFKWPSQNFLASNATPYGQFWLDGFRAEDGKIRQYIFTAEESRGVAKALIGEDRVYAIGIAFYLSKEKKRFTQYAGGSLAMFDSHAGNQTKGVYTQPQFFSPTHSPQNWGATKCLRSYGARGQSAGGQACSASFASSGDDDPVMDAAALDDGLDETLTMSCLVAGTSRSSSSVDLSKKLEAKLSLKKLEVGAGESIKQDVYADPESMAYWSEEPFAFLYINYADENTVEQIVSTGKRKELKEGFLTAVPVGNK